MAHKALKVRASASPFQPSRVQTSTELAWFSARRGLWKWRIASVFASKWRRDLFIFLNKHYDNSRSVSRRRPDPYCNVCRLWQAVCCIVQREIVWNWRQRCLGLRLSFFVRKSGCFCWIKEGWRPLIQCKGLLVCVYQSRVLWLYFGFSSYFALVRLMRLYRLGDLAVYSRAMALATLCYGKNGVF